jgi:hypothetical protein
MPETLADCAKAQKFGKEINKNNNPQVQDFRIAVCICNSRKFCCSGRMKLLFFRNVDRLFLLHPINPAHANSAIFP